MLSGDFPFGDNVEVICSGIDPDFDTAACEHISVEAKSLILKLVNPNIGERWTARKAAKYLFFFFLVLAAFSILAGAVQHCAFLLLNES